MTQSIDREPIIQVETIQFPPGDLWSDEPPLESDLHRAQIELLIGLLKWQWRDRQDFYVSGNLTIYYSPNQLKSEDFLKDSLVQANCCQSQTIFGPDFFVVLGAENRDRRSWVVWQENGKYPNVIIELLSDSTAATDRGLKKQIYQDTFRTPNYFWFHPDTLEFKGFHLVEGVYQELPFTTEGRLWSQQLELYLGIHDNKLRFFTLDGILIESPEDELQRQLEQERQRADQAEQELERLREVLRSQGINSDQTS